jgi:class 3 adenylate cyclase
LEILKKAESILPEGQTATRRSIQMEMEEALVKLGRFQDAYARRKDLSEAQIETLKTKAFCDGTIDKLIGDAIMVLFGAPIHAEAPIQAQKAFECAERILKRMETLNERWRQEEDAEFAIRIGVHQGQAIVGSFGSQKRSDYTAIGLHVNIAARIETAAMPNTIYFSQSIAKHLPADRYTALGPSISVGGSE